MRKFTAIAICHGREDVTTVVRGCELDLRDSRELLPDDVRVLLFGRPESMEVYLLVEVQVFRGTLPLVRIPGVVEPGSVRGPRDASPRGGVVDSRDPIREFSSGRDVVHVDRPVFAAVPGEGDRNMPAVEGGDVEVHRDRPLFVQGVRIDDHALALRVRGPQGHEERLLLPRVPFDREQSPGPEGESRIVR